jgi:hypothetical protein
VRRRAAGRADGRSSTPTAASTFPCTAGRRGLVPALLAIGTVLLGTAAPALAEAPAHSDDAKPVQIVVNRLEPRTVTPGAPIEVGVTLVNDGTDAYSDLSLRAQRGDLLTDRDELADELADPGESSTVTAPFSEVPGGDLEPGDSRSFTYTTSADALQLTAGGVYPLLLNLNGTSADGTAERVGQLSTQLVVDQPAPSGRTTVAWLWPITDRPHRDATGAFTDDDLAGEVADGGRLDRAVEVLEQLPRTAGAEPGQDVPAVPVTLAVDPALLEELSVMAAGAYTVGDEDGAGTADAADLLARLRTAAEQHPVIALAYADVDADALVTAGQTAVVTRSLPGTPEGTARQPVAGDTAVTPADPSAAPTGDPTGDGADAATGTGAGAAIISDVLGVTPRTDLAWPAGGTVTTQTLDTLQHGGAETVVLSDSGLTDGGNAVGADGEPAAARSAQPAAAGDVQVLVADQRLTDAVAAATPGSGEGRVAEQRYLAELGVLTGQLTRSDPAAQQTVLVAPPRQVDPDPASVAAMMADTATLPSWLAPASVEALGEGPASDTGGLAPGDPGLGGAGLAQIVETSRVREDFAAAVVGDPNTVLAGYDAAIARAASAQWRGDQAAFDASAADLRDTVAQLRDQVTLLSPVDGTYSLGSSDAPLVLTVQNDLPFAVDVRLELHARGNVGLTTDDIGVTTLQPSSRTPLQVPTHLRQSGGFAVTARLTTPGGQPLGDEVQMQVKSTAYGPITLGITIGAAVLLGLLFLRRAVRFVLHRRRGGPVDDAPQLDGISGVPPTRSPV